MCDEKCSYCEKSTDIENFSNKQSLGWRVVLSVISWIILGNFIPDGKFYFATMILFIAPLAVDYMKFTPQNSKWRLALRKGALFICTAYLIFCFCALSFIDIKSIDNLQYVVVDSSFVILKNLKFEVHYIWWSLIVFPILTLIDYFGHTTIGEIKLLEANSKVA